MNCHIVFYMAKKTSLCEKSLKIAVENMGFNAEKTIFAITPVQLGETLINSFKQCNIVFTVGGLFSTDNSGIENVLSNALASCPPKEVKKLRNSISYDNGYLIRQGCQLIVVLPDEPEEITKILSGNIQKYLQDFSNKYQ